MAPHALSQSCGSETVPRLVKLGPPLVIFPAHSPDAPPRFQLPRPPRERPPAISMQSPSIWLNPPLPPPRTPKNFHPSHEMMPPLLTLLSLPQVLRRRSPSAVVVTPSRVSLTPLARLIVHLTALRLAPVARSASLRPSIPTLLMQGERKKGPPPLRAMPRVISRLPNLRRPSTPSSRTSVAGGTARVCNPT